MKTYKTSASEVLQRATERNMIVSKLLWEMAEETNSAKRYELRAQIDSIITHDCRMIDVEDIISILAAYDYVRERDNNKKIS